MQDSPGVDHHVCSLLGPSVTNPCAPLASCPYSRRTVNHLSLGENNSTVIFSMFLVSVVLFLDPGLSRRLRRTCDPRVPSDGEASNVMASALLGLSLSRFDPCLAGNVIQQGERVAIHPTFNPERLRAASSSRARTSTSRLWC